jgi:hypothetical protein
MRTSLLAVVAAAGLVGCVGGIETSSPPPAGTVGDPGTGNGSAAAAAKAAFDADVYPIISRSGACIGCHSASGAVGNITAFVGVTAAEGYNTAVGYQALVGDWTATGAPILTKVAAGHQGMAYSPADKDKITAWLAKEITARTGTGTGSGSSAETPAAATIRLTKEWSGCMTLANFTTAKMTAFGNMQANNSACRTCHANGEYGQMASDVAAPFFTVISTNKYYMAQYFSVDLTGGVAAAKIIINTKSFTGVGGALPPHTEHPRFTFAGSAGETALKAFYASTMAAKTAGTCGPSTLTN